MSYREDISPASACLCNVIEAGVEPQSQGPGLLDSGCFALRLSRYGLRQIPLDLIDGHRRSTTTDREGQAVAGEAVVGPERRF